MLNYGLAAVALGANMLEKTITEDRMTRSVEHVMSIEPNMMKHFVKTVRDLEISLGIFLVGFSLWFLLNKSGIISPNKKNSIIGGSLSGFSAGLLGTGGAIRGLTLAAFNLEKSVFIATSAFIDFLIDTTRVFVYYGNGYIHQHDLKYVPFLFVIGILGSYLGKRILVFIPQSKFRNISLMLVLLIGIITVVKLVVVV